MRFTVKALAKKLSDLVDSGHGRQIVCVDKSSFQHNCEEDGVVILEVAGVGIEWVPKSDADGGTKYRKDGTEAGAHLCVLAGDVGANVKGELLNRPIVNSGEEFREGERQ